MCWTGSTKKEKIKHKARKDIEVFKIMYKDGFGNCISPFQRKIYTIGSIYTENFDEYEIIEDYSILNINKGFHSYREDYTKIRILGDDYLFSLRISIEAVNTHKYVCSYYPKMFPNGLVKLKCVIPKGAYYYQNNRGEVVSDSIKAVKIQELNYTITSLTHEYPIS